MESTLPTCYKDLNRHCTAHGCHGLWVEPPKIRDCLLHRLHIVHYLDGGTRFLLKNLLSQQGLRVARILTKVQGHYNSRVEDLKARVESKIAAEEDLGASIMVNVDPNLKPWNLVSGAGRR